MTEDNKKRRIIALILGGFLFIIVIPVIFYFISRPLDQYFRLNKLLPIPLNWYIGIPIAIFGAIWSFISNVQLFSEGKGEPIPHPALETKKLLIRGIYKYSRNPMIFGYILLLIELELIFNSLFFLILPNITVILPILLYTKLKEEKGLESRFEDEYIKYRKNTTFIIPRFRKKGEPFEQRFRRFANVCKGIAI
ncbi:MAG: methyltransferase [Promethearchaeota archaeon]